MKGWREASTVTEPMPVQLVRECAGSGQALICCQGLAKYYRHCGGLLLSKGLADNTFVTWVIQVNDKCKKKEILEGHLHRG